MQGIGGFYYVEDSEHNVHECRAAGKFRKDGLKPLPGDFVDFDAPTATKAGLITEIAPRRNELIRPPAANIDMEIIVASLHQPAVDPLLVDKLILQARCQDIEPVLCINKMDLFPEEARELSASYNKACKTITISAQTGEGVDEIEKLVTGRTVCFAGQSAVGKSTLLNRLCGTDQMTGSLSAKTERGKHTTRSARLFYSPEINAYVMDTPGFSVFDGVRIDPSDVSRFYADFLPYLESCRFSSCLHRNEPDCAVKEALNHGKIDKGRYDRYLALLQEEENRTW